MPSVHFVVDGPGLTAIARNVWSYDPSKALAIMENIEGLDVKTARAILTGQKKLVGQTVCDDKQCRQCKGKKPMQVRKDNAPDSLAIATKLRQEREAKEQKAIAEEAERQEREEDEQQQRRDVLSQYESTEEGRAAVMLARIRGDRPEDALAALNENNMRTMRQLGMASKLMPGLAGLPPEVQQASAAMLDNMLRPPDDSMPEPDDITLVDGLVSPSGDWYSVTYGLHKDVARRIWNNQNPENQLGDLEAEKQLDAAGWLKVGHYVTSGDKLREVFHDTNAGPVTEPQKETMKRWSQKFAPEFRWNYDKVTYLGWLALLREEN